MRIQVGSELRFEFPQTTPMIVTLNVHFSRFSDLEAPDYLMTTPSVPPRRVLWNAPSVVGKSGESVVPCM